MKSLSGWLLEVFAISDVYIKSTPEHEVVNSMSSVVLLPSVPEVPRISVKPSNMQFYYYSLIILQHLIPSKYALLSADTLTGC